MTSQNENQVAQLKTLLSVERALNRKLTAEKEELTQRVKHLEKLLRDQESESIAVLGTYESAEARGASKGEQWGTTRALRDMLLTRFQGREFSLDEVRSLIPMLAESFPKIPLEDLTRRVDNAMRVGLRRSNFLEVVRRGCYRIA